jgi:Rieske Fe-S protein
MIEDESNEPFSCDGCATSRRDFIRDAAAITAGVLAAIGARPALASALPATFIDALAAAAGTVTYPIPRTDGVSIDRKNEVVLARWQGVVYAFALACPHQKTALRWIEKDTRFQCPKHKSKYEPDGTFISGKATRGMDRYSLKRDGENIVVDTGVLYKQDASPQAWIAASVRVGGEK